MVVDRFFSLVKNGFDFSLFLHPGFRLRHTARIAEPLRAKPANLVLQVSPLPSTLAAFVAGWLARRAGREGDPPARSASAPAATV
jgi:hypothetical protein